MLNKVEDFLMDDDFIRLTLSEVSDTKSGKEEPEVQSALDEAKTVLLSFSDVESGLSLLEINELKRRIFKSVGINTEL